MTNIEKWVFSRCRWLSCGQALLDVTAEAKDEFELIAKCISCSNFNYLKVMSLNIFEIWDQIGRQTPFVVRRDYWGEGQYSVVEKIEIEKWPYGKAFGYPIVDGKLSDRFEYSDEWRTDKTIPSSGVYQWSLAESVDINKGKTIVPKKKKSRLVAHSANTVFNFGKHKGATVEAVFRQEPTYILWAVVHADNFCLTEEQGNRENGTVFNN